MTTSDTADIQVEVAEAGPVARTLAVVVDAARVRRAFERAYRELARRVRVRGFRPGKTPRSVLTRLYGGAVAEDVERTLVAETLPAALARAELEPVSEPAVEASPPEDGAEFRYTARIEVQPEIQLPELQGLPARRPRVEVTDADIARELEALRERQAVLVELGEGTAAARGHVLTVDFEGRIDDAPFEGGSGSGVEVELGSDRFLPGFAEQLEGAQAGEERVVRVTIPEDHPDRSLAGREAEFQVRVLTVRRREVPELDDEFAKDLGDFESLDALRERIRRELTTAREREAEATLRRSLLDSLVERAAFEVPPGVVEQRLRRRLAMAREELRGRVPPEALEAQLARWEEPWRPQAEREVREQWLLEAVADAQGLEVPDADLDARLEQLAGEQGVPVARLRKSYRQAGLLEALRSRMRQERAVEFLLRAAKVEEVSAP